MVEPGERVRITALTGGRVALPAVVSHRNGRGMRLVAGAPIAPGQTIQVDIQNGLLLGECLACSPSGGSYIIGLEIEQALLHLDSLANLVANLVGTATPARPWPPPLSSLLPPER